MRYSIITPTLLRDTLARLCDSIDAQTCGDWEHIVCIDVGDGEIPDGLPALDSHAQRKIHLCQFGHRKGWERPNHARHLMWEHATGDYLLYIDDDNYLSDPDVLETLKFVTEPVALFPLEFMGRLEPPLPVRIGRSDGNQLMVRRDIGRWPTTRSHASDGEFIQALVTAHPSYQVYEERALVVYEYAREGVA